MIEVVYTYDFLPDIDEEAYAQTARKDTMMMVSTPGFIEFRAHRNLVGSPNVRRTSVWKSLTHWATLVQKPEFQKITSDFRTYVTNLEVQLWGPSPLVPRPIRPQK